MCVIVHKENAARKYATLNVQYTVKIVAKLVSTPYEPDKFADSGSKQ